MCELFGYSASRAVDLRPLLRPFFSHSTQHPHGWGMARFTPDGPEIVREPVAAYQSQLLPQLLEQPIVEQTFLAHIRLASVGSIGPLNCHPFVAKDCSGRTWTLIHNGTIFNASLLTPYLSRQKGTTDSECILIYLMDRLTEHTCLLGKPLDIQERFYVVEQSAVALSRHNKLNLMLYDGEMLYVHTNMKHTLYSLPVDGGYCFATSPVNDGDWTPLPLNTLHAYRDGKLMQRSDPHPNLYTPGLETISENSDFVV